MPVPGTKDLVSLVPATLVSPMGIGKEEDSPTPQESGVAAGKQRGGEFPPLCPASGEKTFPPGRLFVPLALTQGEGAKQSQVLQRVSDLPSGPFLRAGDVLPLRLYALGSLCLCAQNISYSSPSPLARLAVRPGARGRRCCLSPEPSLIRPLITSWYQPESRLSDAVSQGPSPQGPVRAPGNPAL